MSRLTSGDLAVIVKSKAGNKGVVVRCLEFIGTAQDSNGDDMDGADYWRVDQTLKTIRGHTVDAVPDSWLRKAGERRKWWQLC